MSKELSRRDFIKIVFATFPAAAMLGLLPLWPESAASRLVSNPYRLAIDKYSYLFDPEFDYGNVVLPTFHEHLDLPWWDEPEDLKIALEEHLWRFEHLVNDPSDWSLDEIEEWLDTEVEFEDLGAWEGAEYGPYAPGIEIYEKMERKEAQDLGLRLVECPFMASDFIGVSFNGSTVELNDRLKLLGMNVVVTDNSEVINS